MKLKPRHREKVSVAGALWLTPLRDRPGLAYQTLVNGYFDNQAVALFLEGALQGLPGPVQVVWDGGTTHKGHPINELVNGSAGRLNLETLPAHASELMPMEQVWTWLKYGRLSNWPPENAGQLNQAIVRELDVLREDQPLLRNLWHASSLPLPRAFLS